MRNAPSLENTPRVIAVALVFFGGLALLGYSVGAFDRFDRAEVAALALFAVFFAGLTAALDPGVRAFLRGTFSRRGPAKATHIVLR
jgi:uncharacterized membrane protein (DUF4010 family)